MVRDFKAPPPYQVYVTFTGNAGWTDKDPLKPVRLTSRIGAAHDLNKVQEIIKQDRKAMGETYGGLIEATSTKGRVYRVFKATYTEIKL